mmetsp:Transcript_7990/g.16810  ORF Transcript_7990/g.16810 Transcript_7990/m.16810 type:complete len:100 (+) Transcript_7990:456-755(+)
MCPDDGSGKPERESVILHYPRFSPKIVEESLDNHQLAEYDDYDRANDDLARIVILNSFTDAFRKEVFGACRRLRFCCLGLDQGCPSQNHRFCCPVSENH